MIILAQLLVVVVLAAVGLLHRYLWRRLVAGTTSPGSPWRRAGTVLFTLAPFVTVVALVGGFTSLPMGVLRVLAWPGYLWLAVFGYLLLTTLVGEIARPVLIRRLPERDTIPRRVFVARVVGGAAAAVTAGTVGYGTWDVLNGPTVKRIAVPLAKLPRSADGFRIAVVSDVHLGPILGSGFAQRVTDTINATRPDLIAVVGDLVDGDVDELSDAVEPLARLRSRYGTFFVTGNHEFISGAEQWVAKVRDLGWQPLENTRTELPGFDLAGVSDLEGESTGQGPDFGQALGDRDPARAAVLLAHQPVVIHDAVRWGVDLQLSGHTHGGQLWPGNYLAAAANPTAAGLKKYGDTQLYVSRGAGAWGPPVRVGARSDVTIVELRTQ